uniref:Uncharacterized protein n=1 Tax=Triticum urartu TaxID=4572 RepID=A0A8R7UEH5_TRIUA
MQAGETGGARRLGRWRPLELLDLDRATTAQARGGREQLYGATHVYSPYIDDRPARKGAEENMLGCLFPGSNDQRRRVRCCFDGKHMLYSGKHMFLVLNSFALTFKRSEFYFPGALMLQLILFYSLHHL